MITINGKSYSGMSVSVVNGIVTVDGKRVEGKPDEQGILRVEIVGDAASVTADGSVAVSGQVLGQVQAGGSVHCGDVGASITAGGSVHCGDVRGGVSAGGSVTRR